MKMQKPQQEEKRIMGEIESYSSKITPFPGNRGSRGIKIENKWHNIINERSELEMMEKYFPVGSFVQFREAQNKKGYWDAIEGSLKRITKQEAYAKESQDKFGDQSYEEPVVEEIENVQRRQAVPRQIIDMKDESDVMPTAEFTKDQETITAISREDITRIYNDMQKDQNIKSIKLPFYLKNKVAQPVNGIMTIKVGPYGGVFEYHVDKCNVPEFQETLCRLLAQLDLAKQRLINKIIERAQVVEAEDRSPRDVAAE